MRYSFLETDRLAREAMVDRDHPAMVMCPVCNRSIPEGVPCMVCETPVQPVTTTTDKDLDKPDVW